MYSTNYSTQIPRQATILTYYNSDFLYRRISDQKEPNCKYVGILLGLGDLIAYNRVLFFFGIINAHTEPTPKYMFMDHGGTVPVL